MVKGGNASELGDVVESPKKSFLFFLRDRIRGTGSARDTDIVPVKRHGLVVFGALSTALENPREPIDFRTRSYPYPQQVSKVNSLWLLE